jgi:hypothetical protein
VNCLAALSEALVGSFVYNILVSHDHYRPSFCQNNSKGIPILVHEVHFAMPWRSQTEHAIDQDSSIPFAAVGRPANFGSVSAPKKKLEYPL